MPVSKVALLTSSTSIRTLSGCSDAIMRASGGAILALNDENPARKEIDQVSLRGRCAHQNAGFIFGTACLFWA